MKMKFYFWGVRKGLNPKELAMFTKCINASLPKFKSTNAEFSVLTIREEELVRRVEEDNILQWREEVNS